MLKWLVSCFPSDDSIFIDTARDPVLVGAPMIVPLVFNEDDVVFWGGDMMLGPLSLIFPKSCVISSSKIETTQLNIVYSGRLRR